MSPSALHLSAISKAFGETGVLRDVELAVAPGEFVALVGPSGCGKSTLLRIAAGLEAPDSGRVSLDGRDVTAVRAADRDMAMVFQSYALYPHLTARQNMALPLLMRRLSAPERLPFAGLFPGVRAKLARIHADVADAAESLRIAALLDRKPAQMSGGQRQRVALGRALVRHPRAFLMDEPLSNLDVALRVHMRGEIVELHRRAGVVTLYVTHDQEEAMGMADRIAVMLGGRIQQCDTPEAIYRAPANTAVAAFIGSPRINLLPAGLFAATPSGAATLGVRPEHLRLHAAQAAGRIAVRLERVEFLGAEALAYCRAEGVDDPLIARLPPHDARALPAGGMLHAEATQTLAFDAQGQRLAMRPMHAMADAV